jgi:hypothetical protein
VSLTITAGVPGLEGEHTWNGGIVLGREFGTPKLPRYKVTKWTGLHSLPESDDNRDKNTSRAGETIWPSFARGKTVIPTGVIQAYDLEEMRVATAYMRGQFANRSEVLERACVGVGYRRRGQARARRSAHRLGARVHAVTPHERRALL